MQVYLRESPRSIFLLNSANPSGRDSEKSPLQVGCTALLVTTAGQASVSSSDTSQRAVVEAIRASDVPPLNTLQRLSNRAYGCLGLINVGSDLFVAIVTMASAVGSIRPGEVVMRISAVSFYCISRAFWDEGVTGDDGMGMGGPLDPQGPMALPHEAGYNSNAQSVNIVEHPCASIRKLLGTGSFYFAQDSNFDLSRRFEKRIKERPPVRRKPPRPPTAAAVRQEDEREEVSSSAQVSAMHYDSRFVWNSYMLDPLLEFRDRMERIDREALDREKLFILAIQGFVGVQEILHSGTTIALVSRLSWKRAGTRYNTRGVDDDGNVANFAESETIFCSKGLTMSYVQVRGSVPVFWEQQGLQTFNAKIQVTRPRLASQSAFDRHFADLLQHYSAIYAVNLLGTRDAETILSSSYADHMRHSEAGELYLSTLSKLESEKVMEESAIERIGLTNFDFHTTSRLSGGLDGVKVELKRLTAIQQKRKAFGYTLYDGSSGLLEVQKGAFRTNCLDCLDRTNVVEDIFSQSALDLLLEGQPDLAIFRDAGNPLWVEHRVLWAENGDALSKIYAGTGALNTSYTRAGGGKKTLGGMLSDAAKSASRMYINNFQDKSKQNVIDALLGNMANQKPVSVWDPLHDSVNLELSDRMDEYSSKKEVSVSTGTWNLAGRTPSRESLEPFLFPEGVETADVYALGFQEVVPLTAQQILMTDPEKLRAWESVVTDTFARRTGTLGGMEKYILLRSEQLVGTALMILLKESIVPHIRQVEASTKKTGLKGMSGNKGGVAIRMNIYDTSFCFLTAHFAAGKSNVEERNADFVTISRELHFNSGRSINNSNYCFWFGDFNYRLDGGNEVIRPMCESGDFAALMKRDQLIRAKANHQVFVGYKEAKLNFLPTYKYDFGTHKYDSSEKFRVPAWTDRILYRSQHPFEVNSLHYDRAELTTSDHRPVFAHFALEARIFDAAKRSSLRRELLVKHKAEQGIIGGMPLRYSSNEHSEDSDSDEDEGDDGSFDANYTLEGLPEPSTETQNWWDGEKDDDDDKDKKDEVEGEEGSIESSPFKIQYAIRQAIDSPLLLSSAPVSGRGQSALPPARRPAPKPPATTKPVLPPASSVSLQSTLQPQQPPPIPKKPVQGIAGNGKGTTSSPKLPARPALNSRTHSHTSIPSEKGEME
ncbi:hypothetical protein CBS101457_004741 [Exobasidium rhododendri]|nr:hypothetical protein CBS101457_004741 [Exobasidium rhododendri]